METSSTTGYEGWAEPAGTSAGKRGRRSRTEDGASLRARSRGSSANDQESGRTLTNGSRGLALFSIGLGIAQLTATRAMSRAVLGADTRRHRQVMRAVGVRELTAGLGILARPQSSTWLWSRVLGDVMDLALLGMAMRSKKTKTTNIAAAAAAVLGVGALDFIASRKAGQRQSESGANAISVTRSVTIARSPAEVYGFWRNLQNMPRFMDMIESVQASDERRSTWRARLPGGKTVEWESEIIEDRANESIAWRSATGAPLPNSGEVHFMPASGGRGTQVSLTMEYQPPGGAIGAAFAKLFSKAPEVHIYNDLRRCKQLLELGEVIHSDASIARGMHPARPSRQGGAR